MHQLVTTALDVIGLLVLAAGIVALLLPWIGWSALAAGGLVVLAGSQLAARLATPTPKRQQGGEFS